MLDPQERRKIEKAINRKAAKLPFLEAIDFQRRARAYLDKLEAASFSYKLHKLPPNPQKPPISQEVPPIEFYIIDEDSPCFNSHRKHQHMLFFIYSRLANLYPLATRPNRKVASSQRYLIPLHRWGLQHKAMEILRYLERYGNDLTAHTLLDSLDEGDWDTMEKILRGGELHALAKAAA